MPIIFHWHVIKKSKLFYYKNRVSSKRTHTRSQFLWVLNQPVLSESTRDSFTKHFATAAFANLLYKQQGLTLLNFVKNYQIQSHSRTCKENIFLQKKL